MENPSGNTPHELMTVKETAEYLRIPLPTIYYLAQRGQLPAIQIGGRWRIKRSILDRTTLKKEKPTIKPQTVSLRFSDSVPGALVGQTLKQTTQPHEIVTGSDFPETIITDQELLGGANFSGRIITIIGDFSAPETTHMRPGIPNTFVKIGNIGRDITLLRKLLGLPTK